METDKPDLDNLFVKKIDGTLNERDKVRLGEQLNASESDKNAWEDYEHLWNSSGALKSIPGKSAQERWHAIHERISQDQSQATNRRVWLRYAASVAVVSVLVGVYLFLKPAEVTTVLTNYGQTKRVVLPDESVVMLNAGSSISYTSSLWRDERAVQLDGEAYFEVKKSSTPFSILSAESRVEVLGTTFNVRSRDKTTAVACLTGKVKFSSREAPDNSVILTKGTAASLHNKIISEVYMISTDDVIPWVSGDLSFRNTPLKEVFAELERHFGKKIFVQRDLGNSTFTGKFREPELNNVIKTVCLSAGLAYSISADTIVIK